MTDLKLTFKVSSLKFTVQPSILTNCLFSIYANGVYIYICRSARRHQLSSWLALQLSCVMMDDEHPRCSLHCLIPGHHGKLLPVMQI